MLFGAPTTKKPAKGRARQHGGMNIHTRSPLSTKVKHDLQSKWAFGLRLSGVTVAGTASDLHRSSPEGLPDLAPYIRVAAPFDHVQQSNAL